MNDFKSIKSWIAEDRPREKLVQKGPSALTNAELLAILLNTGTTQKSAIDIAKEIMSLGNDNLLELGKLSVYDIQKIKGIGEKKAITVIAALELGKRRQLASALEKPKISTSRDIFNLLNSYFLDKAIEEFYVVFLNQGHRVLGIELISKGGMTSTVVDIRIIFKRALEVAGTARLVLAHNHPSGNLSPSEADRVLTQRIKDAGKLLDINVLDHVILAENGYYSFADEGIL
jgi:DNA repair protein RadC